MTTITKERLLTIKQWRETYGPGSNVVLPAEEAEELAQIALASLEAKPIGAFHIAEQQVDGTSDYIKDGEWPIDNGTIEVYAAPPAPVVPEEIPMPNPLSMYAVDAVAAIAEVRGWNACRAARGAAPISCWKIRASALATISFCYAKAPERKPTASATGGPNIRKPATANVAT